MTKCRNTSVSAPDKMFLILPNHKSPMQSVWLKACRRNEKNVASSTVMFVCEDHFDLQHDLENYTEVKPTDCKKIMKKNAVPRSSYVYLQEKRMCENSATVISKRHKVEKISLGSSGSISVSQSSNTPVNMVDCKELISSNSALYGLNFPSTSTSSGTVQSQNHVPVELKSCAIQARPHFRSKSSQCDLLTKKECVSVLDTEVPDSTIVSRVVSNTITSTSSESASSSPIKSSDEYVPSSECPDQDAIEDNEPLAEHMQKMFLSVTLHLIETKSRRYLGIPTYSFYVIDLLHKYTKCTIADIYLVLIKIRTDRTFAELADNFGTSAVHCGRIFSKCLPQIVYYMQQLIHDIPVTQIKYLLPISFRARYSHVKYIIDCFEIKIEQPENPVKQALTWSESKKANTMKYLVSATPDGVINFISTGFGGRTTDSTIIKKSGFLDILHPQSAVMADRGIKQVDSLLVERGCTLVRPASYTMGTKLSKEEAIDTKRIASLRIHIERVIRRLREFKMLRLESQIDSKMIRYLDLCVKCACAIANLQGPLIKQE